MKKIIVIADWTDDTLAQQEFRSSLEGYLKEPDYLNISFISSTPSTIHTGFLVSQISETEERYGKPLDTVIFANTDPRLDKSSGAELIVIKLISGLFICGPNAGHDFSLIKNKTEKLYRYQGVDKGSQFRSRDLYSRICAHLMEEMEDSLELEEAPADTTPLLNGFYIGHIDNFGNIKTTITLDNFKGKYEYDEKIKLQINKTTKEAKFVTNLFGGLLGELVIYPGSSGPKDNPYLEISVWRHFTEENPLTALTAFHNPKPGMKIELR